MRWPASLYFHDEVHDRWTSVSQGKTKFRTSVYSLLQGDIKRSIVRTFTTSLVHWSCRYLLTPTDIYFETITTALLQRMPFKVLNLYVTHNPCEFLTPAIHKRWSLPEPQPRLTWRETWPKRSASSFCGHVWWSALWIPKPALSGIAISGNWHLKVCILSRNSVSAVELIPRQWLNTLAISSRSGLYVSHARLTMTRLSLDEQQ